MDFNKNNNIYRTVMLVILTVIITVLITSVGMYNYLQSGEKTKYILVSGNNSDLEQKISALDKILESKYLSDYDKNTMIESAVKGYIEGVGDEYTEYMTKEEWKEFEAETVGNYCGIGIYMAQTKDNDIIVLQPIEGSPAEKVGLKTGDVITKVNGESCEGEELSKVSSKIKGEEGSKVTLEIKREEEILNFELTRAEIELYHVNSEVLEDNIGYLQLISFDSGCAKEFEEKFNELKDKNIKSLIIDLRDNGGGIVEEAISIADLIVPKDKELLITLDKNNNKEITKAVKDVIIDMEIVVLVNENSASASEILAGILKDTNEATIIGTKTYGKGVVQELYEFVDGSAIKITTNEFFTPSNTKIHEVGIEPNVKVELDENNNEDTQLKRAIEELK